MATDTTTDDRTLAALDNTVPHGLIDALRQISERLDVLADYDKLWRPNAVRAELMELRDLATAALVAVGK